MNPPNLKAPREAYLLAGVGGCVDAIGVVSLGGLFVAHMSGNSAAMGAAFGQGDWSKGLPHLLAIPVFAVGLFLGYLWILKNPSVRRCSLLLIVEAGLLLVFGFLIWHWPQPAFPVAVVPLLAMGLQNASLREIGRSSFPTTYVTGVLDTLGKSAARAVLERGGNAIGDARRSAGIWMCYATGAVLGSAGLAKLGAVVVIMPVAALLLVAGRLAGNATRL